MKEVMSANEFAMCIRKLIEEEMEAINSYQMKIERCPCEMCKRILTDIMNEEKIHVGELTFALNTISPEDGIYNADGFEEAVGLAYDEEEEEATPLI